METHLLLTDLRRVVGGTEDELGSTIIARADVRDIWLPAHQLLGTAEVTQLQHTRLRVHKQVLRLDVAMTDAQRVNIG